MKTKVLATIFAGVILTSCSSVNYYQLYKTQASNEVKQEDDNLVYEDENCIVSYNLWSENGNSGFKFYNKTNQDIYLNLDKSFFILNGIAYNYYQNRTITHSTGESTVVSKKDKVSVTTSNNYFSSVYRPYLLSFSSAGATGLSSSKGYSVSYSEEKSIVIPAKTAKIVSEYSINNLLVRNCDLLKYPTKRQIKPVSYSKDSSPITFSNRITYSVGQNNEVKFENDFYVSEISNYPYEEFFETRKDKNCENNSVRQRYYKYASPDNFYIIYSKGTDASKY